MESPEFREHKKFYDSALWQRVRAEVLRREPWCRECRSIGRPTLAQLVDHITPISAGGDRTSGGNLQPLCHECHNAKRAGESNR
jgi:5-methylcytosine-specific restriction protein A